MGWEEAADKRRQTRIGVRTDVRFRVEDAGEKSNEKGGSGRTRNVSFDGLSFTSDIELQPSSNLELAFHVPSEGRPLRLVGEIMWCRPLGKEDGPEMFHFGVKLSLTEKTDECRFTGYVCERMARHFS